MPASGVPERRATLARVQEIPNLSGGAWQGVVHEDYQIPRHPNNGAVKPHVIIDFGAPIRSSRDRNLTNPDLKQPHVLPANIACIGGTADEAQSLMDAVMYKLIDWRPSESSDPWESKGGYGSRSPGTVYSPTRYVEMLFLETVVNQGIDWQN